MDVIKEEGVIYATLRTQSMDVDTKGLWIPIGIREFHYSHVVWIDTLKFAFGHWEKPGPIEAMLEVSTGASAVTKEEAGRNPSIKKLIKLYQSKLISHRAKCGEEVVENFKQIFTIQLWQIKLWAL